jgi:hypothetical protein
MRFAKCLWRGHRQRTGRLMTPKAFKLIFGIEAKEEGQQMNPRKIHC